MIVGRASNGLHASGFSLARKVLLGTMGLKVSSRLPKLRLPPGEELLRVHKNYQPPMASLPTGRRAWLVPEIKAGVVIFLLLPARPVFLEMLCEKQEVRSKTEHKSSSFEG